MSKNQIPLGVVGADGLQFLAVLGQFNGFLAVRMTVLQFLSFPTVSKKFIQKI